MRGSGIEDLTVLVVWSSQLGARARNVPEAAALMDDPRVRHYWDADRLAGWAFADELGLDFAAWDVWMLFAPGVTWEEEGPPTPNWWEHQLGALAHLEDRRLDAERFARKAVELSRRESTKQGGR